MAKTKVLTWLIPLIILIFTLAFISGCAPREKEEGVIKIGATLALTGKYAFIGQTELHGLELAIEEINNAGGINGKKLVLIVEDNKGDPKEAVNNVNKLIDVDGVDVVISAFTHITNAIKSITEQKHKILFYASTFKPIAQESKYNFRDYYDAADHGKRIAELVKSEGHKKVAFLTEISDQCKVYEDAFKERARELGIEIMSREEYQTTDKDLKTQLIKLKLENVDALVTCSWRHEDILMRQLKELGLINKQSFHWVAPLLPSGDTPEVRQLYEENNAISTWYGVAEPQTDLQKDFFTKYQNKFGEKPRADAMYMYDDIFVLSKAFKACDIKGKLKDPDCLSEELLKTDYEGVGGRIIFDSDGSSIRPVTAIKVKNGKWIDYVPSK